MQDVINAAGRGDVIRRMHFSAFSPLIIPQILEITRSFFPLGFLHAPLYYFSPPECLLHSHCVPARLPLGFERARLYSDASALLLVKQRHPVSQPGWRCWQPGDSTRSPPSELGQLHFIDECIACVLMIYSCASHN